METFENIMADIEDFTQPKTKKLDDMSIEELAAIDFAKKCVMTGRVPIHAYCIALIKIYTVDTLSYEICMAMNPKEFLTMIDERNALKEEASE